MRIIDGEVPDDAYLEDKARITIESLLNSSSPEIQLEAVKVVKRDFLAKPQGPQVLALFQSDPRAFADMCRGALTSQLPNAVPLMAPAEDCETIEIPR